MRLVLLGAALVASTACSTSVRLAPDFDRGADPCANVSCGPAETCVDGSCQRADSCAEVTCESGDVCVDGSCVSDRLDADGDGFSVREDCDDHDPEVHPGTDRPCSTDCGEGREVCEPTGGWSRCSAPVDCTCRPGEERREPCRNCGERRRRCTDAGTWGVLGPCENERDCAPGSTMFEPCGDGEQCGWRPRDCDDRCRWGGPGECQVNNQCLPGQSETEVCGLCGTQTQVCSDACLWGPVGACEGEGVCQPGDGAARPCGRCGTETQVCADNCQWDPWSACEEPVGVECTPNDTESRFCGCIDAATTEARTCADDCRWTPWEGCPCTCDIINLGMTICEGENFTAFDACGQGNDTIASCNPDGAGGCHATWSACIPEG